MFYSGKEKFSPAVCFLSVEKVNNFNSQMLVRVELHQMLACVKKANMCAEYFLIIEKSKHAMSGIRSDASSRRSENPIS